MWRKHPGFGVGIPGSQRKVIPRLQVPVSHRIHRCPHPHLQQLSRAVAPVESGLRQEPLFRVQSACLIPELCEAATLPHEAGAAQARRCRTCARWQSHIRARLRSQTPPWAPSGMALGPCSEAEDEKALELQSSDLPVCPRIFKTCNRCLVRVH